MSPRSTMVVEPLPDETLSSWMWRVNSTATIPLMSHLQFGSLEGGIIKSDMLGLQGARFVERDLLSENAFIEPFKKSFNISSSWLEKRFPGFNQLTIPVQFRRAFCPDCFMESFRHVGIPVSKVQWCYLTKPICELHGFPLLDSTELFINHDDYTVQAFVLYWDEPQFKENMNHVRSAWRQTHCLALRVQRQFQRLLRRAFKSGEDFKVQMFMLSLMRAMMMPALHHAYPKIAFHNWGGADPYAGFGVHGDFYQEIYRSTCLARLHALYLSGIALGWITSGQARKTLRENYYAPSSSDHIWSRIGNYSEVIRLLGSELKRYETQYLNAADLNIPDL